MNEFVDTFVTTRHIVILLFYFTTSLIETIPNKTTALFVVDGFKVFSNYPPCPHTHTSSLRADVLSVALE